MKAALGLIWLAYISVGALLSTVEWFSYAWGATFGFPHAGIIGHLWGAAITLFFASISAIFRALL